jgi:hypothetical protein
MRLSLRKIILTVLIVSFLRIVCGFLPVIPGPNCLSVLAIMLAYISNSSFAVFPLFFAIGIFVIFYSIICRCFGLCEPKFVIGSAALLIATWLFLLDLACTEIKLILLDDACSKSTCVINAIESYSTVHGHYPKHIDNLIPEFFPNKPSTGLIGYDHYVYKQMVTPSGMTDYELQIPCSTDILKFDRMIYRHSQNYTYNTEHNLITIRGSWAYVSE